MIDSQALREFEERLEPWRLEPSRAGARVLGYGEISTVFALGNDLRTAYKRMPLFSTIEQARDYAERFRSYTNLLRDAGLDLPEQETALVDIPGRPVVLYIGQRQMPSERFCHVLIHRLEVPACRSLFEAVAERITRVSVIQRTPPTGRRARNRRTAVQLGAPGRRIHVLR